MGNFRPVFESSMLVTSKMELEKKFEQAYQKHKEYFDSFPDSVDVHFNGNLMPMIKMLTVSNDQEEIKKHQEKIKQILSETIR